MDGQNPDGPALTCGNNGLDVGAFTIETWIKLNRVGKGGRLAGQLERNVPLKYVASLFEDRLRLDVWPCPTCGSHDIRSNGTIRDTGWHHIAIAFDGGNQVSFYIDGALDSTKTLPDQNGWSSPGAHLEIGASEGFSRTNGQMSFFRLSNGVRTSFPYGAFAAITNEPTVAVGTAAAAPVTGTRDLEIVQLSTRTSGTGAAIVEALVRNNGTISTDAGFYTDLYLDRTPTGPNDFTGSVRFWVNDAVAAGSTATLVTALANGTYSVLIRQWSPSAGGCGTGYDVVVTDETTFGSRGEITTPSANATLSTPTVTFSWNAVAGAQAYYLVVGMTAGGGEQSTVRTWGR